MSVNAVIADAIAVAEVAVGVVVERAPAMPPAYCRVGGELIVMRAWAEHVLLQAVRFDRWFCGIRVPTNSVFRVTRMVWGLQRETEVFKVKHVFEKFGRLEIPVYRPVWRVESDL